jgi:hypothetical protein
LAARSRTDTDSSDRLELRASTPRTSVGLSLLVIGEKDGQAYLPSTAADINLHDYPSTILRTSLRYRRIHSTGTLSS